MASSTTPTSTRKPTNHENYTCIYCNHSFKSRYCYQKHAKRHLNPLTLTATCAPLNSTSAVTPLEEALKNNGTLEKTKAISLSTNVTVNKNSTSTVQEDYGEESLVKNYAPQGMQQQLSIHSEEGKSLYESIKTKTSHRSPIAINTSATAVSNSNSSSDSNASCDLLELSANIQQRREVRPLDMNVQYYPCKTCGSKFPSYYFVHKHRKLCHTDQDEFPNIAGRRVSNDKSPSITSSTTTATTSNRNTPTPMSVATSQPNSDLTFSASKVLTTLNNICP